MNRGNHAFTLIELLVVIAIVSLLSSIVLASLSVGKKKAQNTAILASFRSFKTWLDGYRLEYGGGPNGLCSHGVTWGNCRICQKASDSYWPPDDVTGPDKFVQAIPVLRPGVGDNCFFLNSTWFDGSIYFNQIGSTGNPYDEKEMERVERILKNIFPLPNTGCEVDDDTRISCLYEFWLLFIVVKV